MPGAIQHFLLTLRLNFRSKQALAYGYLVPIFFLLAFGSVFRSGIPPLVREMGQLLTISTLGGACFGMPTALVADRERGVWRRYRLLPTNTGTLLAGTLLARFVIVASAALMQIALAKIVYGTPLPTHPFQLLVAFTFVAFSFLGMGLVITGLAENVPAVQALGQSIFLPMIMIGGVGVPLRTLPPWAQTVAGFLPGRYAVETMQACINSRAGLSHAGFGLIALTVIGSAAFLAGIKMFRWDSHQPMNPSAKGWIIVALFSWLMVGFVAKSTGELQPVPASISQPFESITDAQIQSIHFNDLPDDNGTIAPLAPTTDGLTGDEQTRMKDFLGKLNDWPPGQVDRADDRARNLLNVAAIADIEEDALEARISRAVFDRLQKEFDTATLERILTWLILHPNDGTVVSAVPELGLEDPVNEITVRDRITIYSQKLLGHLLGKLLAPN